MALQWAVVDQLVHELGSLRAVVQEVEARPELAEADIALELRTSLGHAADTIHLVIGGNEAMVAQAWRTIAEAQEVGTRARLAMAGSRAVHSHAKTIRENVKAQVRDTQRHIDDLKSMRGPGDARRAPKKEAPKAG